MSTWQLGLDLVATFLLASFILFHYGNWYRHHVIVTLAVLVAWYFSFIIVFVLPIDVSAAAYRQCLERLRENNVTDPISHSNSSANGTDADTNTTDLLKPCVEPSSYVGDAVMTNLWRVVYWTSQCLTWLILPMMQSYVQAGDFTIKGKLKSALLDNVVYYGSYLFICGILLAYIAVKPELQLDWGKLKAIASSASNTWGLFLLVFMLGYGLVTLPRSMWMASCKGHSLNNAYFRMAKLNEERNSAEENLDDVLETLQGCTKVIQPHTILYSYVDTILMLIPVELRDKMQRRRVDSSNLSNVDERFLVKLHKQVKRALQNWHRTEKQYELQISETVFLEDVERNFRSRDAHFKPTVGINTRTKNWLERIICIPKIEWYWRCVLHRWVLKGIAVIAGCMSIFVIFSEITFFIRKPVLSLFAIFLNASKENYDYVAIETVSTFTIAYLAVCAFYTVFKIRVFNFYYLSRYHQTDEYSLIFAGMLLCRLTPPLCLNYLGVIHMDSHVIHQRKVETSYTQVMGHMDVLSLISDGFNIYFPIAMLVIALLTWYKVGSRILSKIGFQQFLVDDEITSDLVTEGQQIIAREKRRQLRQHESTERRQNHERLHQDSRQRYDDPATQANQNVDNLRKLQQAVDDTSSVLHYSRPQVKYGGSDSSHTSGGGTSRGTYKQPPRDLFDDV